MVVTHIDALAECIANPNVSDECKEHLNALYNQMIDHKATRKPTKKGIINQQIKDMLLNEIQMNTDYTEREISDIITNHGFNTTMHTTLGLATSIGMRKQSTTVLNADGTKTAVYRRS